MRAYKLLQEVDILKRNEITIILAYTRTSMQSAPHPEMYFDPVSANGTRISTDLVRASLHTAASIHHNKVNHYDSNIPYILSVFSAQRKKT